MAANITRAQEIAAEIRERGHITEPFDGGRWSHAAGVPREANPHLPGHVNHSDWFRGWDAEAAQQPAPPERNPMPKAWEAPGPAEEDFDRAEIEAQRREWEAEQQAELEAEERGDHDTRDSRGQPLRPRVNDAGEPWWM